MTQLIEAIELEEALEKKTGDKLLLPRELGLVGHVMVELSVEVGVAEMSIDRLFSLKAGDVVRLQQAVSSPVILRLNGKAIAHGELVAVDDNFGVHITDIL